MDANRGQVKTIMYSVLIENNLRLSAVTSSKKGSRRWAPLLPRDFAALEPTDEASLIEAMGAGRKAARGMKAYLGLRDEVPTNEAVPLIFGIARGERNFARVRAL